MTNDMMSEKQKFEAWKEITDPTEALWEIVDHRERLSDEDVRFHLIEMAKRCIRYQKRVSSQPTLRSQMIEEIEMELTEKLGSVLTGDLVCLKDVWVNLLRKPASDYNRINQLILARSMRRNGWDVSHIVNHPKYGKAKAWVKV